MRENVVLAPTVALERRIREKLADWRGSLERNVETRREVLRTSSSSRTGLHRSSMNGAVGIASRRRSRSIASCQAW